MNHPANRIRWDAAPCNGRWPDFDLDLLDDNLVAIANAIAVCHTCPFEPECLELARRHNTSGVIQGGIAWGDWKDGHPRPRAAPKVKPRPEPWQPPNIDDARVARSRILIAGECRHGHEINDTDDLVLNGKQGVRCRACNTQQRHRQETAA